MNGHDSTGTGLLWFGNPASQNTGCPGRGAAPAGLASRPHGGRSVALQGVPRVPLGEARSPTGTRTTPRPEARPGTAWRGQINTHCLPDRWHANLCMCARVSVCVCGTVEVEHAGNSPPKAAARGARRATGWLGWLGEGHGQPRPAGEHRASALGTSLLLFSSFGGCSNVRRGSCVTRFAAVSCGLPRRKLIFSLCCTRALPALSRCSASRLHSAAFGPICAHIRVAFGSIRDCGTIDSVYGLR